MQLVEDVVNAKSVASKRAIKDKAKHLRTNETNKRLKAEDPVNYGGTDPDEYIEYLMRHLFKSSWNWKILLFKATNSIYKDTLQ